MLEVIIAHLSGVFIIGVLDQVRLGPLFLRQRRKGGHQRRSGKLCSKTILSTPERKIDSRSRSQPQHGSKNACSRIRLFQINSTDLDWRLLQHNVPNPDKWAFVRCLGAASTLLSLRSQNSRRQKLTEFLVFS